MQRMLIHAYDIQSLLLSLKPSDATSCQSADMQLIHLITFSSHTWRIPGVAKRRILMTFIAELTFAGISGAFHGLKSVCF